MASKKQTKETSSESHSEQTDQSSGKNGSSQQLLINFLFFVVAILIGILVQQQLQSRQQERQPTAQNADLAKLVSELSTKLKSELLQELNSATTGKDAQKPPTASQLSPASEQEDLIVNEKPKKIDPTPSATVATTTKPPANKVVIDHELNTKDAEPEIRFSDGQPIVLNPDTLKFKTENTAKETKTKPQEERKKQPKEPRKEQVAKEKPRREENKLEEQQLSDEIKNFKSTKITKIKPKKLWIPIPNSNGGHRRVPPIEVKDGKEHGSSVKLWLYEEFLSKEECEQLIQAHESHLNEFKKQRPIVCFDSVRTLKKHLADLNREKVADLVTPRDFIEGTMCLNQTFSRQLEKWGLKWSFSTAFYPGF
jgi:cytoskeletal protein RodZ